MSDPIDGSDEIPEVEDKSDFVKATTGFLGEINYKLAFFMFIVGMIVFSDLFIEGLLQYSEGAVDGDSPTTKGTIIQLLVYTVALIAIDLLIRHDWL